MVFLQFLLWTQVYETLKRATNHPKDRILHNNLLLPKMMAMLEAFTLRSLLTYLSHQSRLSNLNIDTLLVILHQSMLRE
jgi:hypothetical protein